MPKRLHSNGFKTNNFGRWPANLGTPEIGQAIPPVVEDPPGSGLFVNALTEDPPGSGLYSIAGVA